MNHQTMARLLEKDDPSVRHFVRRYLLDRVAADREVQPARRAIVQSEPVQKILAAEKPGGTPAQAGVGLFRQISLYFLADSVSRRIGRGRTQQSSASRCRVLSGTCTGDAWWIFCGAKRRTKSCRALSQWQPDLGARRARLRQRRTRRGRGGLACGCDHGRRFSLVQCHGAGRDSSVG